MATKLSKVTLNELSLVDRPANPGAHVSIFKRGDPPASVTQTTKPEGANGALFHAGIQTIAKGLYGYTFGENGKAASFKDVLLESEERRRQYEAREELWPLFDALQSALSSTTSDTALSSADRMTRIETSVTDFLAAVREKMPDVEEELSKALIDFAAGSTGSPPANNGDFPMADPKTVEELQKSLDEVTKRAETAEAIAKMSDAEKAHMAKMSDEEKAKFMAMSAEDRAKMVKKSAEDDETVVVEGQTIAKSAVGPATFAVMKAQAKQIDDIRKQAQASEDRAQMADLTKRAETELAHLPGETIAKAKVLKAVDAFDDETKATFTAMMKAANSGLADAFKMSGVKKGVDTSDIAKKQNDAVAEIMKRDSVTKSRAMEILANENPELLNQAAA